MTYGAKVLADSISPDEIRLTTLEVTFPRLVLAEFNTHRVMSRNSASSRAIPVHKQLKKVLDQPFIPERFGLNQTGMQSFRWLEGLRHDEAVEIWLRGRDRAASTAFELLLGEKLAGEVFGYYPHMGYANLSMLQTGFEEAISLFTAEQQREDPADTEILNVHKQLGNRVLESYLWQTVLVTATEWSNFSALRMDQAAQAEIRKPAELMHAAMTASVPKELKEGEWHTPLIQPDENLGLEERIKVSVGRCARVSYLTHDGVRDPAKDIELYQRLVGSGHMSPTEHAARCFSRKEWEAREAAANSLRFLTLPTAEKLRIGESLEFSGNFRGWHQHRADLPFEADFGQRA